jgi:hypothetical protein
MSRTPRRALGVMRATRTARRAAFDFQRFFHEGQTRQHRRVPQRFACEPCKPQMPLPAPALLLSRAPASLPCGGVILQ